ncbi:MAG: histidine phosphatase family protein [Chloroflexota bacterium]
MEKLQYTPLERMIASDYASGIALVIRHSERHPLNGHAGIIEADLTEKGMQDAIDYGRELATRYQIERVYTSPLMRCIHTAQGILQGANVELPLHTHWWMYSPFLNGSQPDEDSIVIAPTGKIKDIIMSRIDKRLLVMALKRIKIPDEACKMNIYVSHDSLVSPLRAYILGENTVQVGDYPGYLEGIALYRENNQLKMI